MANWGTPTRDAMWMSEALIQAQEALARGERPFGCVIVDTQGLALAVAGGSETPTDPTHHSEVEAIRMACRTRGGLLHGCTIYSTHEPCTMCCGAINHAKLSRVVFGSYRADLPQLFRHRNQHVMDLLCDTTHVPDVTAGVLRTECVRLFDDEVKEAMGR